MKTKGLQKLDGIIAEAIVPNVVIMTDAILEELESAESENRNPRASNVIAVYKTRSKDNLSKKQINGLFDVCLEACQEMPGVHPYLQFKP